MLEYGGLHVKMTSDAVDDDRLVVEKDGFELSLKVPMETRVQDRFTLELLTEKAWQDSFLTMGLALCAIKKYWGE